MGKRGPQPKPVNWEEFFKLVSYQCTQEEVASFFDMSVNSLERRCEADLGLKLGEVWDKKRSLGRVRLRKLQFGIIEKGGPGAATMAIYLDKKMFPDENPDRERPDPDPEKTYNIRTFQEFCQVAGFHPPFERQLEMRAFAIHETDPRLLLGSRGYGKTDYCVIAGVAYELYLETATGKKPSDTTLIMTKSRERNTAILGEIQHAAEANGVIFEKANATSLRVQGLRGKDNSVSAVTIKTKSLRGRHPKRIILDDPVTEDDTSEATRKHVEKIYNELHKLTSNICVIGQPAHRYDLYSSLRPLVKKLEVPHGTIPELDHDLEAQRMAGVDEKSIQASYFLKIVNDGSNPFDKIKLIDKFPPGGSSVAFIDPSHEGGDYTAVSIIKAHFDGIAVQGKVWKKAWNHCLDDMVPVFKALGVKRVGFETNALGDQPIIMLRELLTPLGIGVVGRRSNTNKHSRIMAAGAYAHQIHLSKESDKVYTTQVTEYEYKAKHDDAPDSLATGMQWIGLIRGKE